jgi:hypothetical protein
LLIGIREINNDLPIDELTLLLDNEIINDEKNIQLFLQVLKFMTTRPSLLGVENNYKW